MFPDLEILVVRQAHLEQMRLAGILLFLSMYLNLMIHLGYVKAALAVMEDEIPLVIMGKTRAILMQMSEAEQEAKKPNLGVMVIMGALEAVDFLVAENHTTLAAAAAVEDMEAVVEAVRHPHIVAHLAALAALAHQA